MKNILFRFFQKNWNFSKYHNFSPIGANRLIFVSKYAQKFKVFDELVPTGEARWCSPFFNPFLLKSRFSTKIYGFFKKNFRPKSPEFYVLYSDGVKNIILFAHKKIEILTKFNLFILIARGEKCLSIYRSTSGSTKVSQTWSGPSP